MGISASRVARGFWDISGSYCGSPQIVQLTKGKGTVNRYPNMESPVEHNFGLLVKRVSRSRVVRFGWAVADPGIRTCKACAVEGLTLQWG